MPDSTEQQDTPTEQTSVKEFLLAKLNLAKTGCGCLVLGGVILMSSIWALFLGAPYQVKCTSNGPDGTSVQRFSDRASAEAYHARQVAALKTCTKKYP